MDQTRSAMLLTVSVIGFLLLRPLLATAQVASTGEVSGVVTDETDAALPGAMVSLKSATTTASRSEVTGPNGRYVFTSLVPGEYELSVELAGFSAATIRSLTVLVGRTTTQNVTLRVAGVGEAVEVRAAAPLIEQTRSDIGEVLERRRIEALPLKNREFSDLATLVPQVVRTPPIDPTKARIGNISVAGTGGRNSNLFVDGFENYDYAVGGIAYDVSTEAIQEFNVVTTRFTAEQARSAGAVINIVQRSGTNQFKGDGFYFFRNQDLTAKDFFQEEKSEFRRQQQGVSAGGPLRQNKLFLFGVLEDHRERDTGIVNTRGVYPQFEGNEPLDFRRDLLTAKMDYVHSNRQQMSYRYNLDSLEGEENVGGIRARSNGRTNTTTVQSHAFTHTFAAGSGLVNSFGVHVLKFDNDLVPFELGPQFSRPDLTLGQRTGDPQSTHDVRWQFKEDLALTRGNHSLKFGGEYHRVVGSATIDFATRGAFFFFDNAPLDARFADLLIMSRCSNPECQLGEITNNVVGFYVQDDWKVRPNLTINAGLRWDYFSQENNPDFDGILGLLAPPGSRTPDKNNFAPRVGFVFDPLNQAKLVFRGGYGIYYQNVNIVDALVERGFDGRNLGFRVFFDPGNIDITNPFPGTSESEVNAMFFGPPQDPLLVLQNGFRTPYFQYWSGGAQWAMLPSTALSVDVVHMLGLKGLVPRNINVDPDFNVAAPGAPLCQEFGDAVCQQFGSVPFASNMDRHHYNALVLSVNSRPGGRFQLNGSYTLSEATNLFDDSTASAFPPVPNPFDVFSNRGPAANDQRHRLIFNSVWNPSGIGPFRGEGWEIALISSFSSPLPFDLISASTAPDGVSPVRPEGIPRNAGNRIDEDELVERINAFRATLGIAPLTRELIPENMNVRETDIRISKAFPLGNRFRLRVQGEVFNLFNHANFISNGGASGFGGSGVNRTVESDTVGLPTSTPGVLGSGGPRALQLSARFQW